jgi:outer membrane protein assembly factor BamB
MSLTDLFERAGRAIPLRHRKHDNRMEQITDLAKRLWRDHRLVVISGAAAIVVLAALLGYLLLKRPGDVTNPNAAFNPSPPPSKPARGVVDWPTYGLNNERTRFLPAEGLKPPFKRGWQFVAGTLTEFSPVIAKRTVYGLNNDALAFALNAITGDVKWKHKVGRVNASSPAFDNGRLFMVNLEPGQALALDAASGKTVWRKPLQGRSESSPAVQDGKVVFGCECGTLYALDEKTGKTIWQRNLGGQLKGAPAIANGVVYIGGYDGKLSAVRLSDGSIKWQSTSSGLSFGRDAAFYSTPAVAYGRVYIGSKDSRMYSFEAATGKVAWSHSTGAEEYAAPAVAQTPNAPPAVYFGGLDGTVYALDAKTGKERWSRPAGGVVIGAGSVVGEVFYVANVSKRETVGFSTRTGKRVVTIHAGAYNPVISDGLKLYVATYAGVLELKPKPQTTPTKP